MGGDNKLTLLDIYLFIYLLPIFKYVSVSPLDRGKHLIHLKCF